MTWMPIDEIVTAEPFASEWWPREPAIIDAIAADMRQRGYDEASPLWLARTPDTPTPVLVDGYARLAAARLAGLTHVAVVVRDYPGLYDAGLEVIERQRGRRQWTAADAARGVRPAETQFALPLVGAAR